MLLFHFYRIVAVVAEVVLRLMIEAENPHCLLFPICVKQNTHHYLGDIIQIHIFREEHRA